PDGGSRSTLNGAFVGAGAALVDQALHGLIDDGDPTRVIAELASDTRRYGHLVVIFDDGHEVIPEERTILRAHARHAAIALDAAVASLPRGVDDGPLVVTRSQVNGVIGLNMDAHGNQALAIVPLSFRGALRGVITCGWSELESRPPRHVLDERLAGLADQAA